MTTIIQLLTRKFLESQLTSSSIDEIVPENYRRQSCDRLLRLFDAFSGPHLNSLYTLYYGERQRKSHIETSAVSTTPVSSSPVLSSLVPSSAALSISTVGSIGLSSLGLDNNAPFISPGEVRDTLNLTNLEAGYRDMITPQLTILATNILNMHADNRLKYVLTKAITILLRIYCAPKREKAYFRRIISSPTIPDTSPDLDYENKTIMELQYALYADNEIPDTSPGQTTENVTAGHNVLEDQLLLENELLLEGALMEEDETMAEELIAGELLPDDNEPSSTNLYTTPNHPTTSMDSSAVKINRMCTWIMNLLQKRPKDFELTETDIKAEFDNVCIIEVQAMIRIHAFFHPFVSQNVGD
ncbi:hypothetical protein BC941DRAFT_475689 [Chlamydoabsidia padenii]|nr:hypothetical protein BC941DRAFT_475689 [Chlamydoabsidia padenii]